MVVVLGGDEAHVAVRDDADELVVVVHHRQTGDVELAAQFVEVGERGVGIHRQRIGDHAGFAALDHIHLGGLVVDGEIAVQHADAAVACHRDGHVGLGHRVHCSGQHRHLHRDVAGQMGGGVHFRRNHVGFVRQQQHIVIGEAQLGEDWGEGGVWGFCIRNCSHSNTIWSHADQRQNTRPLYESACLSRRLPPAKRRKTPSTCPRLRSQSANLPICVKRDRIGHPDDPNYAGEAQGKQQAGRQRGGREIAGICTKIEAGGYARPDSWTCLGALLFGSTPSLL